MLSSVYCQNDSYMSIYTEFYVNLEYSCCVDGIELIIQISKQNLEVRCFLFQIPLCFMSKIVFLKIDHILIFDDINFALFAS